MDIINSKSHKKLAIILLTVPILLAIISFVMLIVVNLIFNPTFWMTPDTDPVTATPFIITVLNGIFITIGGIGLLSFLPGLITGVYLLAKQKQSTINDVVS